MKQTKKNQNLHGSSWKRNSKIKKMRMGGREERISPATAAVENQWEEAKETQYCKQ